VGSGRAEPRVITLKPGTTLLLLVAVPTALVAGGVAFGGPILIGTMREQAFEHWSHWVFAVAGGLLGYLTARQLRGYTGRRLVVSDEEIVVLRGNGSEHGRPPLGSVDARLVNLVLHGRQGSQEVPALHIRMGGDELIVKSFGPQPDPSRPELHATGMPTYSASPHDWNELAALLC